MSVTVSIKDETYQKVKKLANDAGTPMVKIVELLLDYALEYASIKTEVVFQDDPLHEEDLEKLAYKDATPKYPVTTHIPESLSAKIFEVVKAAGRPLTAGEIRTGMREMFNFDSPQVNGAANSHKLLLRHNTSPYTWSVK